MIAVGKLAVYTAAAGVDPRRVIPVSLDVGTNNEGLLNDPLYLGNRHARVRGADYDAFIKKYLQTASARFPNVLLHFEDFGADNARRILLTYRDQYRIFNDDMQGTGVITMAGLFSALKVTGTPVAGPASHYLRRRHRRGRHRRPDPRPDDPQRAGPRPRQPGRSGSSTCRAC